MYGRGSRPIKVSLNWFIPALAKSRVVSPAGSNEDDDTTWWPRSAKNSRKAARISGLVMDFIFRTLPLGREPGDGAIGDIGCKAASDEGAYQTSPALGKPPPLRFRLDLDPPEGGFQGAIVDFTFEPGDPFGEITVDPSFAELVDQPPFAPAAIDRAKLDKPPRETLVVEEVELVEPLEGRLDIVVVKALAAELLDELGAEVIAPGDELEGLVVGGIIHRSKRGSVPGETKLTISDGRYSLALTSMRFGIVNFVSPGTGTGQPARDTACPPILPSELER